MKLDKRFDIFKNSKLSDYLSKKRRLSRFQIFEYTRKCKAGAEGLNFIIRLLPVAQRREDARLVGRRLDIVTL